jgi:hypothetical protein
MSEPGSNHGLRPLPDQEPPRRAWHGEDGEYELVIPTVPQSWRVALKIVQLEFPMAVIYGGCLRDMICEVQPNDIDIAIPFFQGRAEHFHDKVERVGRQFGKPVSDMKTGERIKEYLENMAGAVGAVVDLGEWSPPSHLVADHGVGWRLQNTSRLNIQLVALTGEAESFGMDLVLGRCDFGSSRIGYNGHNLHLTSEFLHDVRNREFTVRNPYNIEATYKRWQRINGRYGAWTYVNPFSRSDGSYVESIAKEAVIDDIF